MRLGIMQPYFLPYIGYFQLMNAVDEFVVYDNIEYTKKGWINRNRILVNGKDQYITLPLKKDSDYKHIIGRELSETWRSDCRKLLNQIREVYRMAPRFEQTFPLIEEILLFNERNLFVFILNSLERIKRHLQIKTKLVVSSTLAIDEALKSSDKVKAICNEKKADVYINPIGGLTLYSKRDFQEKGISLRFLKTGDIVYQQFNHAFIPFLSILDVLMFNNTESVQNYLTNYELIESPEYSKEADV